MQLLPQERHAAYFANCHFCYFANGLIVNICWRNFVLLFKEPLFFARKGELEDLALSQGWLFAIAGHFVSYRWVSGPHNFLVILWNLLMTKKIVQQKQTTNESNKNPCELNASRAARNSFAGRMFVTSALSGRIPRKCARRAQRFTFISDFERLYKNAWEIWETARNRAQWENITVHRGLDQPWCRQRDFLHTCNSYAVGSIELALFQTFSPISGCLTQWRSQPKNWGGKKLGRAKMFDFRQITLFCLEKRLS